jgi:SAM domain (Sterile alpha motif)
MDIAAWLRGLGLERYEAAFRENEIDWGLLPKLTADDLRDLGVSLVGHRRKLLEAIADLSAADAPPEPIPLTAPSGGSPLPNPPPHAGEGSHYNPLPHAGEGRVGAGVEAERRQLTV